MICEKCGKEYDEKEGACPYCNKKEDKLVQYYKKEALPFSAIVMIISCAIGPVLYYFTFDDPEAGLIYGLVSLAWKIPLTILYIILVKKGKKIGVWFGILVLILVSRIAGISIIIDANRNK